MIYKEIQIRNFINHNVVENQYIIQCLILNIWNEVYVLAKTF